LRSMARRSGEFRCYGTPQQSCDPARGSSSAESAMSRGGARPTAPSLMARGLSCRSRCR
jgi:hypothetical protein